MLARAHTPKAQGHLHDLGLHGDLAALLIIMKLSIIMIISHDDNDDNKKKDENKNIYIYIHTYRYVGVCTIDMYITCTCIYIIYSNCTSTEAFMPPQPPFRPMSNHSGWVPNPLAPWGFPDQRIFWVCPQWKQKAHHGLWPMGIWMSENGEYLKASRMAI